MNDVFYGCPTYDSKPVTKMSNIELKGILMTLVNDYTKERLKNLVVKLCNIHYSKLDPFDPFQEIENARK